MRIGNRPAAAAIIPNQPKTTVEKTADAPQRRLDGVSTFEPATPVKASAAKATAAVNTTASTRASEPTQTAEAPEKKGFFARIGEALSKVGAAASNFLSGVGDAVVGAGKNLVEAGATFGSGVGKLFKGDLSGGFKDLGMSLVKVVQTPVDAVIMLGGKAVSFVQTAIGVEPAGRKLNDTEIATLRKVYGDGIDYSKVTVKEGEAGLYSKSGRAFVLGDTVYLPPGAVGDTETLVHEMGHIWQGQNGGTDYLSEALWGQYLGDGYDFAKGIDEGKAYKDLNPEQQAQLISVAFGSGFFDSPGGNFTYQGKDYTAYLNDALVQVRAGQSAP